MSVAAVGGIYELVRFSSANLREKDDALNTTYGGFLAGTVLGLRRKVWTGPYLEGEWLIYPGGTTPAVLGFGALTAVVMGAYDYTGGRLTGYQRDPKVDEFDRKEYMRKNRRRPIEETIAEIGEGRGITAPERLPKGSTLIMPQVFMHQVTKNGEERGSRRSTASTCRPTHLRPSE